MASSSAKESHPRGPQLRTHPTGLGWDVVLGVEAHHIPFSLSLPWWPLWVEATEPPLPPSPSWLPSMHVRVCAARCARRAHLGSGFSQDKGMLISSLYCCLLSRTSSHAWTWHSGMRQRELLVATSLSPVGECNVPSRERGRRGGGNKSITAQPARCQPIALCTPPEAEVSSASRCRERRHRFCSHGLSCSCSPPRFPV